MNILGKRVTDNISGFTGVVTGYVHYLSGCNQALVVPKNDADGNFREARWFDDQRLTIHDDARITLDNPGGAGFDKAPPK